MKNIALFLGIAETRDPAVFFDCAVKLDLEPVIVVKKRPADGALNRFRFHLTRRMAVQEVLSSAQEIGVERIAGVYSPMSQYAELAAVVAETLGLPHSDPSAVAICRDKFATRARLAENGFTDVRFTVIKEPSELAPFFEACNRAVVLKPRVSSGATGVRICTDVDDALRHTRTLLKSPGYDGSGIAVEEYITGAQYGVEIFDGRALCVRRKHITAPPASLPYGHDVPAQDPPDVCAALAAHAEQAVKVVGYVQGAAHVEVRMGPRGPALIEINPRLSGALGPENVKQATGIDLVEACIQFACDLPYDLNPKFSRASAVRHLLRSGAPVRTVEGTEQAKRVPGVIEVGTFPKWFHRRGPAMSYSDRIAYVVSQGDTPQQAIDSAEKGLAKLRAVEEKHWQSILRRIIPRT